MFLFLRSLKYVVPAQLALTWPMTFVELIFMDSEPRGRLEQ